MEFVFEGVYSTLPLVSIVESNEKPATMQIKLLTFENFARIFFIVSVLVVGFAYGFLSHRENWFPQPLIHEASLAARALWELETKYDGAAMPASFKAFDSEIQSGPNLQAFSPEGSSGAQDWVLVVGGPYEYLEECPTFGCLAWVIDHSGAVIHAWEVDLEQLWSDVDHVSGITSPHNFKPTHVELLPDGSIIAVFWNAFAFPQGSGLARFDIDGNLVWAKRDNSHHWFTMDPDGRIYVPLHRVAKTPFKIGETRVNLQCKEVDVLVDYIQVVDTNGKEIEEIPIFDIFVEEGYTGLIERTELPCDPFHLNFVQYVDAEIASRLSEVEPGDLLVSIRNTSTVALLDPEERKLKWLISGLNIKQHSPRFLPDGSIVVFDNLGGDRSLGGSRIVRHEIHKNSVETLFPVRPGQGPHRFLSDYAGHIDVHPDGRSALVSVTDAGTMWHIDLNSGEVNWVYGKAFSAENYPQGSNEPGSFVRVEAFGGYFVDRAELKAALAKRPKE